MTQSVPPGSLGRNETEQLKEMRQTADPSFGRLTKMVGNF